MFKTLQATFQQDKDYPLRTYRLSILARVIDGTLYDNLPYAFHEEKNEANEYIKLRERRPSVRYGLCKLVVDDSVSLLFSEGHFPEIDTSSKPTRDALARLIKEVCINERMISAATRGSVGSVALLMRVLDNRVFIDVMETPYLVPTWKKTAPDTLTMVREQYKVKGDALRDAGYEIKDEELSADFWFRREWTEQQEIYYTPWKVRGDDAATTPVVPKQDAARTINHALGFVPVIWIRNLPGGDEIDGKPTFPDEAVDTQIEIDYQLSQGGRALKYSGDPTLLIKEPAFSDGTMVRGASNAITVDANGDAKLLEINGTATEAVINYVVKLRELALETMHGNRANADKISAAQSGRAMELMNQALIWLADRLRISYGEGALLSLLQMIVAASNKLSLIYKDGTKVGKLDGAGLALRWPAWYQPTADDLQNTANTLRTLVDAAVMSRKTAIKSIAAVYDIEDVEAEYALAESERKAREADAQKQVKIQE